MRSEIRNIKSVCKYGAFGNPDAVGFWIYGKRRDGKTVACKNKRLDNGGIIIWSEYWKGDDLTKDETEFSDSEWEAINKAPEYQQKYLGNLILDARNGRT